MSMSIHTLRIQRTLNPKDGKMATKGEFSLASEICMHLIYNNNNKPKGKSGVGQ